MIDLDWLRSFVAVYQTGSVTAAASVRSLTQPAVSQHLAALEAACDRVLFERSARGVTPTPAGTALYREVFEPVLRLERSVDRLRAGRERARAGPLRVWVPADFFAGWMLPRLDEGAPPLVVTFAEPADLNRELERGETDAIVTRQRPAGRALGCIILCEDRYVLVGPARLAVPRTVKRPAALARWLAQQPWLSFSEDLPITRRFWQQVLGRRFDAQLRLVAPDLRTVLQAVERGLGCSILPQHVCAGALAEKRIRALWPVEETIPAERWYLVYRLLDQDRPELTALRRCFAG